MAGVIDCPIVAVVDGDSLRCGAERLRLLGIDAPELHGCPSYRQCVAGDGPASKRSLQVAIAGRSVRYRIVGKDRFGRSLVMAWAGGVNLACRQIKARQAVYKARWDNGGLVARECAL